MQLIWDTKCWIVTLVGIGCIQAFAGPFAQGLYLGQTPSGSTAQVFASGLICRTGAHQWESHGSFSADGNTFCYARNGGIFITENTDPGWTVPRHVESVPDMSFSACVSPDANSIYFMYSYGPPKPYHPFRCRRTADGWSSPQELEPLVRHPGASYGGFSFAADNSIYIFVTWPKAGRRERGRERGTFLAPYVDRTWTRAIKLSVDGGAPGIAPDASFMVFNANNAMRGEGLGATDLYLTLRQPNGSWSEARNLGPKVNSRYFEFGARISPDKKYLFFTHANGWGENRSRDTADIYWVELKEYLPESYR